ncbi:adrenodoxin-like protein 2, mitochondrial [Wolffia australiana]
MVGSADPNRAPNPTIPRSSYDPVSLVVEFSQHLNKHQALESVRIVAIMILSKVRQAGLGKLFLCASGSLPQFRRAYRQRPFRDYLLSTANSHSHHLLGRSFSSTLEENKANSENKERITVTFMDKDGEEKEIKVPVGMSMLEAAHANDIELEGACEGSLACSTCHVIVMDVDYYNKMEDPTDEENDMLDLAFGLTETSRLGCQIVAAPELDGLRLALPAATRNFAVDGFVPKPH